MGVALGRVEAMTDVDAAMEECRKLMKELGIGD